VAVPELLNTAHDVAQWVVPILMVPLVARRHGPMTSLAWLAVIAFLPITGSLFYFYFGWFRITQGAKTYHETVRKLDPVRRKINESARVSGDYARDDHEAFGRLVRYAAPAEGEGFETVGGNAVVLIADAEKTIERLIADVEAAERSVHLCFYLYAGDATGTRVGEALMRAAARGVECRLLAGSAESWFEDAPSLFNGLSRSLERAGVDVKPLRPLNPIRNGLRRFDLRNHRKIAVIDGVIGYTGSQNIHDPDCGLKDGREWRQMMVRMHGPAALQLQTVFVEDWYGETRCLLDGPAVFPEAPMPGSTAVQIISSAHYRGTAAMRRVFVGALQQAHETVTITSPYFVPDLASQVAMEIAALRGVRVELVLPRRSDSRVADAAGRAYLEGLLRAGVHVYRHDDGVLHTKSLAVDDAFSLVGSANFDQRSFYLDAEVGAVVFDAAFARELRDVQARYRERSEELDLESWQAGRSRWREYADHTAKLFSPVL
jgi:cardiolipin synthase